MSRESQHLDQKLLLIGKKLIIKKGASGFNIRELTDAAKVNLGMFSYHFKNKDNFVELLLEKIYEELLQELNFSQNSIQDPLSRLEAYLLTISLFARKHRDLILSLMKDVLDEHKIVKKFIRKSMRKHFWILAQTLKEAQQQNLIIDAPIPLLLTHVVGSIGLTNLTPSLLKKMKINKIFDIALHLALPQIESDEAIKLRIKMTIQGLKKLNK